MAIRFQAFCKGPIANLALVSVGDEGAGGVAALPFSSDSALDPGSFSQLVSIGSWKVTDGLGVPGADAFLGAPSRFRLELRLTAAGVRSLPGGMASLGPKFVISQLVRRIDSISSRLSVSRVLEPRGPDDG